MRRRQAKGPYLVAGYSAGGLTAFEMARQLTAAGEQVSELFILENYSPTLAGRLGGFAVTSVPSDLTPLERLQDEIALFSAFGFSRLGKRAKAKFLNTVLRGKVLDLLAVVSPTVARSRRTREAWLVAAALYRGGGYAGSTSLVISKAVGLREERFIAKYPNLAWEDLIPLEKIGSTTVPCDHLDMVKGRFAEGLTAFIEHRIKLARGVR
jgi:thioesterase domain-containing protein